MQQLDRRHMLVGIAISALGVAGGPKIANAKASRAFFEHLKLPIGLQVYTLGADAGKDIELTFATIAEIGFREIELPNMLGHSPEQVGTAARNAGLTIRSIHLPLLAMNGPTGLSLASEPERIANDLQKLGAQWAVAPIFLIPSDFRPQPGEKIEDTISRTVITAGEDIWKRTASTLNAKAAALKPLGIKVGYHNHNVEFAPIGSTTGWNILRDELDPTLVKFEVDIGWVVTAGLDPISFLKSCKGRVRLLHVKDVAADNPQSYRISMHPAEVGAGVLDWKQILPTAHEAGVEHFLVEQEPPFSIPRLEAAARSYSYLAQLHA